MRPDDEQHRHCGKPYLFAGAHTPEVGRPTIASYFVSHPAVRLQHMMELLALDRSNTAQTVAVALVTIAALTLLAVVAAYWTWCWLAPPAELRTQESADSRGDISASYGLFGTADLIQAGPAPTGMSIKLHGIVTATPGRPGYAVVQLEPREILTVREGEDITPGIRLTAVNTDHVILDRGGIQETLSWPKKSAATESTAPRIHK